MTSDVKSLVWVEAYRPRTIEECILPPRLKEFFQQLVDKNELQNMTLVGGAGTGKTTVARALCEQMGIDYIVINASEERNIDTIRTTVRQFGSTMSLTSDKKCIILDEADYLNANSAQPALRGVIEEFAGTCYFIQTCNFGNRIIEPLLSRCPVVDFSFSKQEREDLAIAFAKRLKTILKQNEIEFENEQLFQVVVKNFPDFRRTLNLLQRYTTSGRLEISSMTSMGEGAIRELVKHLKAKEFGKMRKWVVENLDNDGAVIRRGIYDQCFNIIEADSIPEVILLLAQYDYKESFVADREVNMVAMLTEIMATANFK
ncbi:clamp loader of DNA polymerase [Acidovorax phage ACP17]|uniref:Sliding-clamp-loader large subunit n=1 Tax=Acidovorax phage ACP17 TaxID=2010329 RepID=A0A218M2X1_9CAUD|nr:clamp loader of DNA polymerase [Acidovorax phage ACP17]ASD50389.1 replication factor C small subunit / DNA polymerase clamp loader subunit [Acidovorax phage ACP17]